MLVVSILPEILWTTFAGILPPHYFWWKAGTLLLLTGIYSLVPALRRLRIFLLVFSVYLVLVSLLRTVFFNFSFLQKLLGGHEFISQIQGQQLRNTAVSLLLILILLLFPLGYTYKKLFLIPGDLRSPIRPVPWLGFPKPDSWVSFGGQYGIYLAAGTGLVLFLTSGVRFGGVSNLLAVLPAVLLMAALNAFNEEFLYRSVVISALEPIVGTRQVWYLSALFFGIAHFWGVPSGWLGILLASFMGWILSKAMLETRGFFWSWWIHFLQDVAIFLFLALSLG